MKTITGYPQYKNDIFNKLAFHFEPGKRILDVGCGDATDAEIFIKEYNLDVYGIDVYKHENVDKLSQLHFQKAEIFNIPHDDDSFDYVFLHDVLHHIDEKGQSIDKHIRGLAEIKRVTKKKGCIIIIEGNRYNPLFYPHMVKMLGHDHWKQLFHKSNPTDVSKCRI
jgi:ubiquinone/menaquinone biosynthesis C-methylase UbiE